MESQSPEYVCSDPRQLLHFRGKNSAQSNDFRVFAWEEMHLNDFLYANGEVTRLWMYPRGPDSGFNVYPGRGDRFTYFGTSHVTHALGEPAFVVRELVPRRTRRFQRPARLRDSLSERRRSTTTRR